MVELRAFDLGDELLRGRRCLVTGASGFIGGRLAERLSLEHRAEVVAFSRSLTRAVWVSRYAVQLQAGDVLDPAALDDAARGCETVFHCASGGGNDKQYLETNVLGTKNILAACRKHRVRRLIYVSSIAVHGPSPPDGANEFDAFRSFGRGYSDSKIAAEKLLLEHKDQQWPEVTIIRPSFVWGPRSSLFTARPLREMRNGQFHLVDEGRGDCHAVFVEHLVDAILAAAVRDDAVGRPFLVTDGYGINWKQFFEPYADWLGISHLPSLNSASSAVQLRCRLREQLVKRLEAWQGNPAPFWKRVCRRSARHAVDFIGRRGAMTVWDLQKFARRGALDTSATKQLLKVSSRYRFDEAMAITEQWVRDQMGFELKLTTPPRTPSMQVA